MAAVEMIVDETTEIEKETGNVTGRGRETESVKNDQEILSVNVSTIAIQNGTEQEKFERIGQETTTDGNRLPSGQAFRSSNHNSSRHRHSSSNRCSNRRKHRMAMVSHKAMVVAMAEEATDAATTRTILGVAMVVEAATEAGEGRLSNAQTIS